MRMIGYYALHTFINSIKKMFRSTVIIILVSIIAFGMIFGVAAGLITTIVEKQQTKDQVGYVTEYESETEVDASAESDTELLDEEDQELSESEATLFKQSFEFGIAALTLLLLLYGFYKGMKKGTDIFLMADVNFLFTAPMKPQSVLMFRLTFQMVAILLGSIYLVFQIPNLMINLNLNGFAVAALFLAWIFVLFYQQLFSVLAYTLTATYSQWKKKMQIGIYAIAVAAVAFVGTTYLNCGKDFIKTMQLSFGSKATRVIPIIGWFKGMIMAAVEKDMGQSFIYMALLLAGIIFLFLAIWNIKADFYEDAMTGAATREETLAAAREGRKSSVPGKQKANTKFGKWKAISRKRTDEKASTLKGAGGTIFFWKEVFTRRRDAKFGFITNTMIWYLGFALVTALCCVKFLNTSEFAIVGAVIAIIAFFRNYGNPIARETSMNWLFLVPDNPYKKVFFAMMAGTYACFWDLLLPMVISACIMHANPVSVVLWIIQIVTMDFMLSTVGMMLEVLLPASALDVVKSMLQFMLKCFMILLIVVIFTVGAVMGSLWMGLVLNILFNLVLGGALFVIYPSLLHDGIS